MSGISPVVIAVDALIGMDADAEGNADSAVDRCKVPLPQRRNGPESRSDVSRTCAHCVGPIPRPTEHAEFGTDHTEIGTTDLEEMHH
jgi:hypothetical protein